MASYPAALMTPTVVVDDPGGTEILAAHHNSQDDEILAIETELGTDVAGSVTNLKTRLAKIMAADGTLEFADSTVLTLSSYAITVTQNFHRVATEGGAATDNLETINGLANDGTFLILRPSTSNDIVINDNGNILTTSGNDITLYDTNEFAILIYDGNLAKWLASKAIGGSALTTSPGATDNQIAVYTNNQNVEGGNDLRWTGSGFILGDGDAGIDYTITVDGQSADGVITWMEDEDYFKFSDEIMLPDSEKLLLGTGVDASIYYNGTNLIIDPDAVGTGNVTIDTAQAGALTIGNGAAGVDYAITVNGETADGVLTWMEDEDWFSFGDAVKLSTGLLKAFTVQVDTYNITAADVVVIMNKGTAVTTTLPAATATGRTYQIKNIGAGACTVEGNGAETIDGAANKTLDQWEAIEVLDYASGAWVVLNSYGTIT